MMLTSGRELDAIQERGLRFGLMPDNDAAMNVLWQYVRAVQATMLPGKIGLL